MTGKHCKRCGIALPGTVTKRRRYCSTACRMAARSRKPWVPKVETPRERYLRQCAETSWESY